MVQAGSTCCEGPVVLPNFKHQIYKIWMCISCVIFHLEMNFPVHNFILYIFCLVCVVVSVSLFDFKLDLLHQAINLLGCQRSTFDNRFVFCASQKTICSVHCHVSHEIQFCCQFRSFRHVGGIFQMLL